VFCTIFFRNPSSNNIAAINAPQTHAIAIAAISSTDTRPSRTDESTKNGNEETSALFFFFFLLQKQEQQTKIQITFQGPFATRTDNT
jgi:hypothetical protein